jgi:hypothetical protein
VSAVAASLGLAALGCKEKAPSVKEGTTAPALPKMQPGGGGKAGPRPGPA